MTYIACLSPSPAARAIIYKQSSAFAILTRCIEHYTMNEVLSTNHVCIQIARTFRIYWYAFRVKKRTTNIPKIIKRGLSKWMRSNPIISTFYRNIFFRFFQLKSCLYLCLWTFITKSGLRVHTFALFTVKPIILHFYDR